MFSKLLLALLVLAFATLAQCQGGWMLVTPNDVSILMTQPLFRKGLDLCKDRVTQEGKTYSFLFFVRLSTIGGYTEYNLNDTEGNCHVCATQRQNVSAQVVITNYIFIPKLQGKSVVSDESSENTAIGIQQDIQIDETSIDFTVQVSNDGSVLTQDSTEITTTPTAGQTASIQTSIPIDSDSFGIIENPESFIGTPSFGIDTDPEASSPS